MARGAIVGQVLFVAALVGVWEAISRLTAVDPTLLPPATVVLGIAADLFADTTFLRELGVTALEVAVAFAIAVPLAISSGFLLGEKVHLGEILNPFVHFALAVPQSVFLPVFVVLFGVDFLQKVIFGVTHAYFVIVVNTVAAVHSVPRAYVNMARVNGASSGQIYLRVYVPAMLPLIMTGLRLGMIFNIIGVLLAEMYGARGGIGRLLFSWGEMFDVPRLLAGIVIVSLLTIVVSESIRVWEDRLGRWQTRAGLA